MSNQELFAMKRLALQSAPKSIVSNGAVVPMTAEEIKEAADVLYQWLIEGID